MSWTQSNIGNVLTVLKNGINCDQNKSFSGDKITRIETIAKQNIDLSRVGYANLTAEQKEKSKLQKGDILFSHINSPIHVGKTAIYESDEDLYHGINLLLMRPIAEVNPKFFNLFLNHIFLTGYWEKNCKKSVNQASVNQKDISKVKFDYPPLATQQKIVEKLDAIFAEIDKAVAATEANIKNAEALFQSYLSNIQAPSAELGKLVTIKTGKLDSNASVDGGKYPFFTCSRDIFSINEYAFDCEAVLLAGNNASGDFNVKYYKGKFNAYQRTYVITIDAINKLTYKYLYFQLINALKQFKEMSVGAGTKFLKIGMIKGLKFPLPAMDVQVEILKKLEYIEKNKNLLQEFHLKKLSLSNSLKQSILRQAFSGELVKD